MRTGALFVRFRKGERRRFLSQIARNHGHRRVFRRYLLSHKKYKRIEFFCTICYKIRRLFWVSEQLTYPIFGSIMHLRGSEDPQFVRVL